MFSAVLYDLPAGSCFIGSVQSINFQTLTGGHSPAFPGKPFWLCCLIRLLNFQGVEILYTRDAPGGPYHQNGNTRRAQNPICHASPYPAAYSGPAVSGDDNHVCSCLSRMLRNSLSCNSGEDLPGCLDAVVFDFLSTLFKIRFRLRSQFRLNTVYLFRSETSILANDHWADRFHHAHE